MAIYHVFFSKTDNDWTSSVARQTESKKNLSQVAIGESELMTKEQALAKITKELEKRNFTKDEIIFKNNRQSSLEALLTILQQIN